MDGPPDHLWQIFVAVDGPPDQVWLPQMILLDHLWHHRLSPLATDGSPRKTLVYAADGFSVHSKACPRHIARAIAIACNI